MRYQLIGQIRRVFSPLTVAALFATAQVQAQDQTPASTAPEYDFSAERGPHHRRVETTVTVPDADGKLVEKPTRYIELATGLNYLEDGLWKQSEEKIEPHPRGAAALKGYYKAIFGKNLNRAGAIELTLPDGQKQKNHPLGLYYYDRSDGRWVKLSGMKDSEGVIIPPNRVLYRDAFDSIRGDLLYTYEKGRFEADVILRERPAAPDIFGLSNDTTMLEMATEFTETPEPRKTERLIKKEENQTKRVAMAQPDVTDEWLDFGSGQMLPGTAFPLDAGGNRPTDSSWHVPVSKHWQKNGTRNFLSEQVEYLGVEPMLAQLNAGPDNGQVAQTQLRTWPDAPAVETAAAAMSESSNAGGPGVVLDYDYVPVPTNQSSYTFYAYNPPSQYSYMVVGNATFSSCTFNSGAVIKYVAGKKIQLTGVVSGSGTIFTAENDNTVGGVTGSGSPSGSYGSPALEFLYSTYSLSLSGMEFRHANHAVDVYNNSMGSVTLSSPTVRSTSTAFYGYSSSAFSVSNPYFCAVTTQTSGSATITGTTTTCVKISDIPNQTINEDDVPTINFTVGDSQTSPNSLTVTASSSNQSLVPNSLLIVNCCTMNRTLTIVPMSNASGTATITVTATDGVGQVSDTFLLTVNAVNDPPTITPILRRGTIAGQQSVAIAFTIK